MQGAGSCQYAPDSLRENGGSCRRAGGGSDVYGAPANDGPATQRSQLDTLNAMMQKIGLMAPCFQKNKKKTDRSVCLLIGISAPSLSLSRGSFVVDTYNFPFLSL
jgi:hypothetical protein